MTLTTADISKYVAEMNFITGEVRSLFGTRATLVIFDIGACEGEDSIRYSRVFPNARIFCFEPLPANQQLIKANLEKYGTKTVELVPVALSNSMEPATFHVSGGKPPEESFGKDWNYGNKSSSLLPPVSDDPMFGWLKFEQAITVPCDTLDHFCEQRGISNIDFIHMDVQGAEHLVLSGATNMLRNVTAIWLEVANRELYRGQKLRSEMEQFMKAAGFVLADQALRGDEGDQFYLNSSKPVTRAYLLRRKPVRAIKSMVRFARRAARWSKRKILGAKS
jgi:FkbM family methyltransferase